eukprot:15328823-Ditylum_brightwellii.AAC.1
MSELIQNMKNQMTNIRNQESLPYHHATKRGRRGQQNQGDGQQNQGNQQQNQGNQQRQQQTGQQHTPFIHKYCRTHSVFNHWGPECWKPDNGHQQGATFQNKMGGSVKNYS